MSKPFRSALLLLSGAALAACGKPPSSIDPPLAYAPADTPYAFANLSPPSPAMIDWYSHQMQAIWPPAIGVYEGLIDNAASLDARDQKLIRALLDELRDHGSYEKLRELGYKPDAHFAIYGVGLVPVLRMELSDPAAFKATIARIESKAGEKIATGKTGDQDYWQFSGKSVTIAVAVQGAQLVATLWAADTSDAARQLLLGLKKPDKNLLDAGTLQAIAKKYNYSPYGDGYVDFAALAKRLSSAATGADLEIAKAMQLPTGPAIDNPVCVAETQALAQKFPRLVIGGESMTPPHFKVAAQLEIEPTLAQALMAAFTAAPGTGAPAEGLIDISVATPLLKLKSFWLKQADAVAAKPFACPELAGLNDAFAKARERLGATIPPPFSDLTGMRVTIDKLDPRKDTPIPDIAARALIGSNNPLAMIGMAQMAVPQLKDWQIKADGKPVALPDGLVPASVKLPPISIAMTDKAIGLAAGESEEAALTAYFTATPGATPVFLRMHFSGAVYGLLGKYANAMQSRMSADKKDQLAQQTQLFSLYEKMIRSGEFTFEFNPNGFGLRETVELGD
ncbi:MAG: hypothetical protein JSR65_08170 [Proteobacteria bacterium]|nr:hypothetical protein [Pseudomonadota bacterium]